MGKFKYLSDFDMGQILSVYKAAGEQGYGRQSSVIHIGGKCYPVWCDPTEELL